MDKIKWLVVAILLLAPFILPVFHFTFDISLTLTVVSLLFAIFAGFFISTTTTNYLRLQSLISNANSDLIKMFRLSKLIQPSSAEKIANLIDQYMIAILDFSFLDWIPNTQKEFNKLTETIEEISPVDDKGLALFPYLHETKYYLYQKNLI